VEWVEWEGGEGRRVRGGGGEKSKLEVDGAM